MIEDLWGYMRRYLRGCVNSCSPSAEENMDLWMLIELLGLEEHEIMSSCREWPWEIKGLNESLAMDPESPLALPPTNLHFFGGPKTRGAMTVCQLWTTNAGLNCGPLCLRGASRGRVLKVICCLSTPPSEIPVPPARPRSR